MFVCLNYDLLKQFKFVEGEVWYQPVREFWIHCGFIKSLLFICTLFIFCPHCAYLPRKHTSPMAKIISIGRTNTHDIHIHVLISTLFSSIHFLEIHDSIRIPIEFYLFVKGTLLNCEKWMEKVLRSKQTI